MNPDQIKHYFSLRLEELFKEFVGKVKVNPSTLGHINSKLEEIKNDFESKNLILPLDLKNLKAIIDPKDSSNILLIAK